MGGNVGFMLIIHSCDYLLWPFCHPFLSSQQSPLFHLQFKPAATPPHINTTSQAAC